MLIDFVHIHNFRKLKNCRIEFSDGQTLFVGANNSGKTTAMDALMLFFKFKNKFTTRDFTLSNWITINTIGQQWNTTTDVPNVNLSLNAWIDSVPTLDIWLNVNNNELHYVHHLIPKLDWTGGLLGIRLRLEPDNIEELYKEFSVAYKNSNALIGGDGTGDFKIWPTSLWDFLDEKGNLNRHFKVKTYLLDPDHKTAPQILNEEDPSIDRDAFRGLIKIDIINAQRGFSDVNSETADSSNIKNLSSQLRSYYDKHLNPTVNPTAGDINALKAINEAKKLFDKNLKECFSGALGELAALNYPGFGNPTINLSTSFNTLDGLNHDSAVQYSLDEGLYLPEKYNGLGYQNLISIIFKLIRFRDEWMQVGKNYNEKNLGDVPEFEPLHLVLIEEPEAHLHAQVQQVFIKKAFDVLRSHSGLIDDKFKTQLVISTHSSHIAHEVSFKSLRYFKRSSVEVGKISTSDVVNLSKTFGNEDDTTKFARRYLKTTHCDLFFADAVIMVEGPAERMLVPYFIKRHSKLDNCYLSILEIGGSHAHKLRPLIDSLGIITLIITDIDSILPKSRGKKAQPVLKQGLLTGNDTIKNWVPKISELDKLMKLTAQQLEVPKQPVRVAYQLPIKVNYNKKEVVIFPYTFEDSLVMTNKAIFSNLDNSKGLLQKMSSAAKIEDPVVAAKQMYDEITSESAKKAEFALELFYFEEPNTLAVPKYISEGLKWLENNLIAGKTGLNL